MQIEQTYKPMKKVLFKFYGVNFLMGIILYIAYRFFIINKLTNNDNWFDKIISIIDAFLNVQFAIIFLAVIVFSSLTFFLNLIEKIRENYFLSLLTFLGIPLLLTIYLIFGLFNDYNYDQTSGSPLINIVMFSMIYLFIITIEFFLFRKTLKNINK